MKIQSHKIYWISSYFRWIIQSAYSLDSVSLFPSAIPSGTSSLILVDIINIPNWNLQFVCGWWECCLSGWLQKSFHLSSSLRCNPNPFRTPRDVYLEHRLGTLNTESLIDRYHFEFNAKGISIQILTNRKWNMRHTLTADYLDSKLIRVSLLFLYDFIPLLHIAS